MNDLVLVFCPPLSKYQEQPKDMSKCIIIDCPECKNKMWLSEKKEEIIKIAKIKKSNVVCVCYDCFLFIAKDHPEWKEHIRIDL